MAKETLRFRSGKFIQSESSLDETTYAAEANFGNWESQEQAEKFYKFLGHEGLKILKIDEEADDKITSGKVIEHVKANASGGAVYVYSVQKRFKAKDEDAARKLFDWLQHGAIHQSAGQAKLKA